MAGECGIDLSLAKVRYAQRPSDRWNLVSDLSKAKDDLETDFYGSAAAWHQGDRTLVERWGMELDTGDFYRLLFCLDKKQIRLAESTSWSVAEDVNQVSWGYDHRWKLGEDGRLETSLTQYIDLSEKPAPTPKLDAETLANLTGETMDMKTWADLGLPDVLLR